MSRTVDSRVVELQFDNKQFERGVAKTQKSLKKLRQSMDFDKNGSASSLDGLKNAIQALSGVNFDQVSNALDAVTHRFSVMGQVGATVIQNLTNRLTNMAIATGKSLTIDQITAGMSKYEQKMNAVRTMMNTTGQTEQQIEESLQVLADYADMTSYSYSQMTDAAAKFTNAGQKDMGKVTQAIMGISNAAALAGVNTTNAQIAYVNFSQAMSKGMMKLDDWKSIMNLNMATDDLKQAFIDAAIAAGTLEKKVKKVKGKDVVTYKTKKGKKQVTLSNFDQTLSQGWMTSDVMLQGLQTFGDNTEGIGKKAYEAAKEARTFTDAVEAIKEAVSSGWSQSFQYLFGSLEQATKLWTGFCDRIIDYVAPVSEARNAILGQWHERGGYQAVISSFSRLFTVLQNITEIAGKVFSEEGLGIKADDLLTFSYRLNVLTGNIRTFFRLVKDDDGNVKATGEGLKKLEPVFKGIAGAVRIVTSIGGSLLKGVGDLLTYLKPLGMILLDIAGEIGLTIKGFADWAEETGIFQQIVDALTSVLKPFIDWIIGPKVMGQWKTLSVSLKPISDWVKTFLSYLPKLITDSGAFIRKVAKWVSQSENWKKVVNWFSGKIEDVKKWGKDIWKSIKPYWDKIKSIWSNFTSDDFDIGKKLGEWKDKIKSWLSDKGILEPVTGAWNWLKQKWSQIKDWFGSVWTSIGSFFKNPSETAGKWWEGLKGWFTGKWKEFCDWLDSTGIFGVKDIGGWFQEKWNLLVDWINKIFGKKAPGEETMEKKKTWLDKVKDFFGSISNFFKGIVKSIKDTANFATGLPGYIALFGVIFAIIGTLLFAAIGFSQFARAQKINAKSNAKQYQYIIGIIGSIAGVVAVTALAIFALGKMSPSQFKQGAIGIVGALAAASLMLVAAKFLDKEGKNSKSIKNVSIALLAISAAITVLAYTIGIFKQYTAEEWLKGLGNITVLLILLGTTAGLLSKFGGNNGSWQAGTEIVAMAGAMYIIVLAIKKLADLDEGGSWQKWGKAMLAALGLIVLMGGVLFVIGRTTKKIKSGEKYTSALTTIIAFTASVAILAYTASALALLPDGMLVKAGIILASLSGIILAVMGVSYAIVKASKDANNTAIMNVVFIIVSVAAMAMALAFAINMIRDVSYPVILSFLGGIAIIIAAVAIVAKASQKAKPGNLGVIVGILAVVGLLGGCLGHAVKMIKDVNYVNIIWFLAGVAAIVVAVGLMVRIAGGTKISPGALALMSLAIAAVGAMGILLAVAIKQIKDVDPILVATFLAGVSVALLALSGAFVILGKMDLATIGYATLAMIALGVALSALIYILSDTVNNAILDTAETIQMASELLADSVKNFNLIQPGCWDNAVAMIKAFISLGAEAAGKNDQIQTLKNLTTQIWNISRRIQLTYGNFANTKNFTAAYTKQIKDNISNLASIFTGTSIPTDAQISTFHDFIWQLRLTASRIGLFYDDVAAIKSESITQANSVMGALGAADGGVASILKLAGDGGQIDKLSGVLSTFGGALKLYGTSLEGIPDGTGANTDSAMTLLTDLLTKLRNNEILSEDDISLLPSEGSISDSFAPRLVALGGAILDYATSVSGITPEMLEPSTNFLTMISNIYAKITEITQTASKLGAQNLLGSFADNISALGTAVGDYAFNVSDISDSDVEGGKNVIEFISDIYSKITEITKVATEYGENMTTTLGAFGDNMANLGVGVYGFYQNVKDVEFDKEKSGAAQALDLIVGLYDKLPKTGGLISWVMGQQDLGRFGSKLNTLGIGVRKFWEQTKDLKDIGTSKNAAEVLNILADMQSKLGNTGGLAGLIVGDKDVSQLGRSLGGLGAGFVAFTEACADIVPQNAEKASQAVNAISPFFSAINETSRAYTNLSDIVESLGANNLTYGGNRGYTFAGIIKQFVEDLSGIQTGNAPQVISMMTMLIGMMKDAAIVSNSIGTDNTKNVSTLLASFGLWDWTPLTSLGTTAGIDLVTNIGQGMVSGNPSLVTAIDTLCNAMKSEEMLAKYSSVGSFIATSINGALADQLDSAPVIRPVIDYSGITGANGTIQSMLNGQNGIGMSPMNFGFMPTLSTAQAQNINVTVDHSDIIEKMNSLEEQMSDVVDRIGRMQVRLDTNALVGQLTPKLDRALGAIIDRKLAGRADG